MPASALTRDEPMVELATGEASYRIPLALPVATGAVFGPLALEYRSGTAKGGSGWMGLGWRLAGLSSIERDTRRGAPYDYAAAPACNGTYCYRPAFTLDGQDLLCEEASCRGARYRTQSDDGRLIRFEEGFWTVQDREGTVRRYGSTPDSRVVNPKNGEVFAWLQSSSADAHGNWARYEYEQPPGRGVAYLRAIRHAQSGEDANREVLFELDRNSPRDDRFVDYRAGFRREVDRRLETIEVRAAGERIFRYVLGYAPDADSGRSLLASVQKLGRDDASARPPHRFEYTRSTRAFEAEASALSDSAGCLDRGCQLNGSSTLFRSARASNLVDLDRDGLPDVHRLDYPDQLRRDETLGPTLAHLHSGSVVRSEPVVWSERGVPFALPVNVSPGVCSNGDCDAGFRLMDLTGDGYPDGAFYGTPAGGLVGDLLLGGPAGFREPPIGWPRLLFDDNWNTFPSFGMERSFESEVRALDMTGDGLPDWVEAGDGTQDGPAWPETGSWRVLLNQGLSSDKSRLRIGEVELAWNRPRSEPIARAVDTSTLDRFMRSDLRDLNGDGLPDRVQVSQTPGVALEVAYNYGAGFDPLEPFAPRPSPAFVVNSGFLEDLSSKSVDCTYQALVDLNGDGLLDYASSSSVFRPDIYVGPERPEPPFWLVALGTGSGLSPEIVPWQAPRVFDAGCLHIDPGALAQVTELMDMDGDGLLDKVMGRTDTVVLAEGELAGLLARAQDPDGGEVEFRYAGSAEMLDRQGRPANPGLGPTRPVVVRTERRSGQPGSPPIVDLYHYARGVHDFGERELRGFGRVTQSALLENGQVESETLVDHATDRACAGRPVSIVVRRPGEIALARTRHEYLRLARPGSSLDDPDAWTVCLPEITRESAPEGTLEDRTRRTVRVYGEDPIATHYNVLRIEEWGVVEASAERDLGDDERFTHFEYAKPVDPALHLVSRPSEIRVTDASGNLLAATRFLYDGTLPGVVGRRGLLAGRDELLFGPGQPPEAGRWIATRFAHDRYGNQTEARGPATRDDRDGLLTALRYDERFAALPIRRIEGADAAAPLETELRYGDCTGLADPPPGLALPCEIRAADGAVDRLSYDGLGRLAERRTPNGLEERWRYDEPSPEHPGERVEVLERSAPGLGVAPRWSIVRDGLGRVTREESPAAGRGRVQRVLSYDARGRLLAETRPHFVDDAAPGARRYAYDALDRVAEIVEPDGETRELRRYEPRTEIREIHAGEPAPTRRLSFEVRHRDGRDRLVRVDRFPDPTLPDPRRLRPVSLTASYDSLDRLLTIYDAVGTDPAWCHLPPMDPERSCRQRHSVHIEYDSLGRRTRLEDPDAGRYSFVHDDAGRPLSRADPTGRTVALRYDAFGRPTRLDVTPDGEGVFDTRLVWQRDPARPDFGRLVGATSDATRELYGYDAAGQLLLRAQTTLGVRLEQRFDYDELGRLRSRTFPDGETYRYGYEGLALARIERAGDPLVVLAGVEYDALGRPLRIRLGSDGPDAVELERSYAAATGRLARLRARTSGGEEAFRTDLVLDGLGRLLEQDGFDAAHPLRSFGYDGLGRLVRATGRYELPQGEPGSVTWSYAYDALGNLRAQRSSGARERRFEFAHPEKPGFLTALHEGEQVRRMEADAAGRTASIDGEPLRWNALGRLLHGPGARALAFRDVEGRRIATLGAEGARLHAGEDFDYRLDDGLANKRFQLGRLLLATRATSFAATREDGSTVPVQPASGAQPGGMHAEPLLIYATDALGSVRAVIDAARGSVVETRDFAPYGEAIAHEGSLGLRHRFAGAPQDDLDGLYELGARPYDPQFARFLSPDELLSIERTEGAHRYAYAGNQPTGRVDPSGRFFVVPDFLGPSLPSTDATVMIAVPGALLLIDLRLPVPGGIESGSSSTLLQQLASLFPAGYGAELRLGMLQVRLGQTLEGEGFLTYSFVAGGGLGLSIGPKSPPGFGAARQAVNGKASVLLVGGTVELDAQAGPANLEVTLAGGVVLVFPADGSPALAVPYHGVGAAAGGGQAGASVQLAAGAVLGAFRLGEP
jgi:RHS repeat-associated protein